MYPLSCPHHPSLLKLQLSSAGQWWIPSNLKCRLANPLHPLTQGRVGKVNPSHISFSEGLIETLSCHSCSNEFCTCWTFFCCITDTWVFHTFVSCLSFTSCPIQAQRISTKVHYAAVLVLYQCLVKKKRQRWMVSSINESRCGTPCLPSRVRHFQTHNRKIVL